MKKLIYLIFIGMAISCKKDQPIIFTDDFDCLPCASGYCTPVEVGDTSQIQVDLTALSADLITNGNFASASGWTVGADWAISGGTANSDYNLGGTDAILSRAVNETITEGYYQIQFDLISDAVVVALKVYLGGALIPGPLVGTISGAHVGTTTYKLFKYIDTADITDNLIQFEAIAGSGNFSIDNVSAYRLSAVQYTIQDCETDEVFYTDTTNVGISYFETALLSPTASDDKGNSTDYGYAIITLDWDGMDLDTDQCYCMCIKDKGLLGYEYIRNGNFDSTDFWDIVNTGLDGWAITGGQAVHTSEIPGGNDTLTQTLQQTLDPEVCYVITFDVIDAGSWGINVFFGTQAAVLSGSGNSTQTIEFSGETVTTITFSVGATNDSIIDNVSIKPNPDAVDRDGNSCFPCIISNCISLKESWDTWASTRKMCNILVTGSNDNSAFGFASDYDFSGRIFGVIRNGSYPDIENTEYKDLTGLKSIQYNDNEKFKELQVYQVPSGVHDWLRLALRCQDLTLTINGTEKSFIKKPGDYTPNWRKSSPEAPVIVEIQEVQQVSSMARNV